MQAYRGFDEINLKKFPNHRHFQVQYMINVSCELEHFLKLF